MHAALMRADADFHGSVLVTQRQQLRSTMHEGKQLTSEILNLIRRHSVAQEYNKLLLNTFSVLAPNMF